MRNPRKIVKQEKTATPVKNDPKHNKLIKDFSKTTEYKTAPIEYDEARILLQREVGRYAFALLDDDTIEMLVQAVAKGRKLSFLTRRDAYDREREAFKTIRKEK